MIENAKAALSWTGKIHGYTEPLPDRGTGETFCQRIGVATTSTGFEGHVAVPMGKPFPVLAEDLQPMPNPDEIQGVAAMQSNCNFCLNVVDPPTPCTRTRDLLEGDPELAGKVIVGCDRKAMHTGKHRDSVKAIDWWG